MINEKKQNLPLVTLSLLVVKTLVSLASLVLLCLLPILAKAQTLTFKNENLQTIFQQIEQKTDLVFNFNPELLATHTYTGTLKLDKPEPAIQKLLYDTPFLYELNKKNVLIILPEKTTYKLCGYIKGTDNPDPLPYTNIFAKKTTQGVQADENGYFEWEISGYKNQRIEFSYLGCKNKTLMVQDWTPDDCKTIKLQEYPDMLGLDIIIKDYIIRGISEGEEYGSVELDYETLSKKTTSQEHDVLKTIQHLPGITSIDESASRLSIRGSAADHNLVLWENAPLYDPGHLFGMISSVNPYVVDEINIYKTSYAPELGNTIGGVIDISLDDDIANDFHGGLGVNLTEAHGDLKIPILKDQLSLTLSGRHSISEIWASPTLDNYVDKIFQNTRLDNGEKEEGLIEDAMLNFHDWNAKIIYQPSDKIFIKSSYLNTHNYFGYKELFYKQDSLQLYEEVTMYSNAWNTELQINWTPDITTKLYYVLADYRNDYNFSFSDKEEEPFFETEKTYNSIKDQHFGYAGRWNVKAGFDIDAGYIYENKKVNYSITETSLFEGNYDEKEDIEGNFHNLTTSIGYQKNDFSLRAGIRQTYYTELGNWFFSPRINVQYLWKPNLKLKGSAGRFHQFVSQLSRLEDKGINTNNPVWILSSDDRKEVLNANKIATGFIYNKKNWLLDVEAYYHKNRGISSLYNSFENEEEDYNELGESTIVGLEVLLNKNWEHYKIWANYSLSRQQYYFAGIQNNQFPGDQDHLHNLSVINNIVFGKWQGAVTWQYRSGLPFSTPTGLNSFFDEEDQETYYELDFEDRNNDRLSNYNRLDLGITYQTPVFKNKANLQCNFSLLNIFNHENIASRNYYLNDTDNSGTPEKIDIERYMLGRTPQFMIRLSF